MMLDNNMFKRLDYCVSQTIQRRESISGPFILKAPTLPSELQCFGRVYLFVVVVVVVVVICRNIWWSFGFLLLIFWFKVRFNIYDLSSKNKTKRKKIYHFLTKENIEINFHKITYMSRLKDRVFMSPVPLVFHTVVTVNIGLKNVLRVGTSIP